MQLFVCFYCQDVVALRGEPRSCICGRTTGRYMDDLRAIIRGDPGMFAGLGFANRSFMAALVAQRDHGDLPGSKQFGGYPPGRLFEAFVLPNKCPSVTYERLADEGQAKAAVAAARLLLADTRNTTLSVHTRYSAGCAAILALAHANLASAEATQRAHEFELRRYDPEAAPTAKGLKALTSMVRKLIAAASR